MQNREWKRFYLFLIIAIMPLSAYASSNDGVFAGSFLRMGLGARALAMGGAFTAIAEGPTAAYYNPGGMPFLEKPQVTASYRFLSLDRKFNYLGFARGIRPKVDPSSTEKPLNGGMALSWIYAGVDDIDGRGFAGQDIGSFSTHENAFSLSFGLAPAKFIGIGLNAKVMYARIPNVGEDDAAISEMTFGMDFGVLVKPLPFVTLGLMIKDLNAQYDWKTESVYEKDIDKIDRFPKTYRGGIAVQLPWYNTLVAFDLESNDQYDDERYFVGLEAMPVQNVVLRTGINNGNFAGGAGYAFSLWNRQVELQYALVTKDYDIGSEHVFSWVFQF